MAYFGGHKGPDLKPEPKKKEKKGLKRKFKPTGEGDLFKKLFEERPHVSFITGDPIYNIDHNNCAHVLPKAKNRYPEFKLYEKNIVFLSRDEHFVYDNMAPSDLKKLPEFDKLLKLKEELLKEHRVKYPEKYKQLKPNLISNGSNTHF